MESLSPSVQASSSLLQVSLCINQSKVFLRDASLGAPFELCSLTQRQGGISCGVKPCNVVTKSLILLIYIYI